MQPLYSVDHETRQNNRMDGHSPSTSEDTPLLYRFPLARNPERNLSMAIAVALLLMILITGVIIGIYLLVLQSNSENILPPVETPLQLVTRKQWDHSADTRPEPVTTSGKSKRVIVVQTGTKECWSSYTCALLLQTLEKKEMSPGKMLPYNFLVSSNGETYESLGWYRASHLFPQYPDSLLLAFIGNFTAIPPTKEQIDEAKNFIAESVSQQHLDPSYTVFGKKFVYKPAFLFKSLKHLPRWDTEMSD